MRRLHSSARRSHRGRIALALDRSQGWIIVTIVGVLTALVAFLIVRGMSEIRAPECPGRTANADCPVV